MSAFQALVDQAPDGVVILEAGRVVYMNETAGHLLGVPRDQALGRPIASFLPPADAALAGQRIGRLMTTGEEVTPADYGTLADPSRVVEIKAKRWEWEGRPAVLAFARDVTERKAMAQQLVHADRLAAIGTLAAGVAHEVNNPLAYVQLSLSLIEEQLRAIPGVPDVIGELLHDAAHGVDRVATIVRALRAFVRPSAKDGSDNGPLDVTASIEGALRIVDNDLRHRGRLIRAFQPVPAVLGHAARLEQVLVNLLLNAIQALPGRDTDTITVEVVPHGTSEVAVTVRDTGTGMTPAVRARMFDPFFTTRPIGEGIGLGLAVSKSLVEAMGGKIIVESEADRGTSMTIVLRASRADSATETPSRALAAPDTTAAARASTASDTANVQGAASARAANATGAASAGAATSATQDRVAAHADVGGGATIASTPGPASATHDRSTARGNVGGGASAANAPGAVHATHRSAATDAGVGSGANAASTPGAASATHDRAAGSLMDVVGTAYGASRRSRVLIIDDEPLVRTLLAELLAPHHDTVVVANGRAAVSALEADTFDVVLCDVMMPGMSGVDVYRQLAATRPGMEQRFVFITGGAFTAELESFLADCGNDVLAKPFQLPAVLAAIDRLRS